VTRELVLALARAGADIIELGVPFSDPIADGPVIQHASERALRNRISVAQILEVVADARAVTDVPIVIFSYLNPLLQFGVSAFARQAARVGVAGVLLTDLPLEEAGQFATELAAHSTDLILLAAPTSTDQRLRLIAERASGFIYAVSRNGVTGISADSGNEAEKLVARLKALTDLPVAVGFGIGNAADVAAVGRYADAAVVGSAIVSEIAKNQDQPRLVDHIESFVRSFIPKTSARANL